MNNITSSSFELLNYSSDSINNSIKNFTSYRGRTFILLSILTGVVLIAYTIWKRKDLFFCFNSNNSTLLSNDSNKSIPPNNDSNKSTHPTNDSNDSNNSTAPLDNSDVDIENVTIFLNENKDLNITSNSVSGVIAF